MIHHMDFAAKMSMFVEDGMESFPTKKIELHLHSLEKWRTPNQKLVTADPQK